MRHNNTTIVNCNSLAIALLKKKKSKREEWVKKKWQSRRYGMKLFMYAKSRNYDFLFGIDFNGKSNVK